jgi:hypothetical protein
MFMADKQLNAIKYLPRQWQGLLGRLNRDDTIRQTIQLIAKEILTNGVALAHKNRIVRFNCLTADDLSVDFVFTNLPNGINSTYDAEQNCICFDNQLKSDGIKIFSLLHHEYTHKLQYELSKHLEDFQIGSIESEYLLSIINDAQHKPIACDVFGISFNGQSYIDPYLAINNTLANAELIEAVYSLQTSERSAFDTEQQSLRFMKNLGEDTVLIDKYIRLNEDKLHRMLTTIREECKQPQLQYADICYLIDSAKNNICTNKSPKTGSDIEAFLTYKIATILRAQNATKENELQVREEYNISNLPSSIKLALNSKYVNEEKAFNVPGEDLRVGDIVFTNDLFNIANCDTKQLVQLNEWQQISNPKLIAYALLMDGQVAAESIKNIDAFKLWYYSNQNALSCEQQTVIENILGVEFSPEYKENAYHIVQEYINSHTMHNDQHNNVGTMSEGYLLNEEMPVINMWNQESREQ